MADDKSAETTQSSVDDLDTDYLQRLVEVALVEDRAWDDLTTAALIGPEQAGRGLLMAKAQGVIAGLPVAAAVFQKLDPSIRWQPLVADGSPVSAGQAIAIVEGPLSAILRGERVALNFLQHLSGVATASARLVQAVKGLPVTILDTRKTMPGLRALQKYAVRMGGATNHRMDLSDGVLIKDNHLAALRARGLGITDAVRLARQAAPPGVKIEIEVTNLTEAQEALSAGADELLLDNMTPEEMRQAVEMAQGRVTFEASGRITLENIRTVAESGVDYISSGSVTHSVRALDISLELEIE